MLIMHFLHLIVQIYQFNCAVLECDFLSKMNYYFLLCSSNEFGPKKDPNLAITIRHVFVLLSIKILIEEKSLTIAWLMIVKGVSNYGRHKIRMFQIKSVYIVYFFAIIKDFQYLVILVGYI